MATLSAARAQPAAVSPTAEPAPVPRGPIETLSVLLRFGAVMAVVLAAASLPASSLIGVRRVVVVGARTVSAADIVSRSGIRPGDRLLGISTARAAARVRTLPRAARAEVLIGLGGAVTIHVAERRPYAAVALRGRYLLLDASGVVIDTVPAAGRLPVVATLEELDEIALIQILTQPKNALLKQFQKMFGMEGVELEVREAALKAVARRALERKTGARGLRSILEHTLLNTMFDLPSLENVVKVVVDENTIVSDATPLLIYSDQPKVAGSAH